MCKMAPPKKLYKGMAFTTVLLSSLWLVACGGGSSRSDNNDTDNTPNVGDNGTGTVDSSGPLGFDAEGNLLHTTIPSVSELTTDANYQGFLFYSVAAKNATNFDKYTLKAVNPSLAPITSEIITTNIQKMDSTSVDTVFSFPAANISNGKLSDYNIDRMMFLKKTGTSSFDTRVVSSTGTWPPTPQTLSLSSGQNMPGMVVNYAFQHNLIEPQNSTFSYVDNSSDFNRYITTINPNNNTDKYLNKKLTPVASLVTAESHSPNGWIMGDFSNSNSKLYEYANDGSLRGELTSNGVAIENVAMSGETKAIPGTVFADGSQLLAIHQIDLDVVPPESTLTVYRYLPSDNGSLGTLEPLKNSAGETLVLRSNTDVRESNIAIFDDATYLFDGSGNSYELYRLEKDQWSEVANTPANYHAHTVVTAGDFMVWQGSQESLSYPSIYSLNSANNKIVKLDSEMMDKTEDPLTHPKTGMLSQPFFGNTDGMLYYNRKRSIDIKVDELQIGNTTIPFYETREWVEAVARKADGSGEPTIILHAFWNAASTNGKGALRGHMSLFDLGSAPRGITNSMELSEIFLVTKHFIDDSKNDAGDPNYTSENTLVAVNAAAPKDGMVELGDLPSDYVLRQSTYLEPSAAAANIGELGSGPSRLLTFKRQLSNSSECAITYVNTRKPNSLIDLEPTNAGGCQVVRDF